LLLELHGVPLPEIAVILEVPYGTAGSRLHHARRQLRACLRDRGYRLVRAGSELPPDTSIIARMGDELLLHLDWPRLERAGYHIVPAAGPLPAGWRVVLTFSDDEEVLIARETPSGSDNHD
jgi:hypothetical protein